MLSKLPSWITLGGVLLSFIAGYINAIGFVHGQAVSHMTGIISQTAINVAHTDWARAVHSSLMVLSFFVGCVISGFVIPQSALKWGRRYGAVLMVEALCLFGAVPLLNANRAAGFYLAALACGLQNSMASSYSGAIVRTTHLTGFINDFGIAVGHLLRGSPIDQLRFRLYALIVLGFLSGGILGVWLNDRLGFDALYLAATTLGILGLGYFGWAQLRQRHKTQD